MFDSATASYSFTGIRDVSVSFSATHNRFTALTQSIGKYKGYTASLSSGYRLFSIVHLTGSLTGSRYQLGGSGFDQDSYTVSVGLAFSPGEYPLQFR